MTNGSAQGGMEFTLGASYPIYSKNGCLLECVFWPRWTLCRQEYLPRRTHKVGSLAPPSVLCQGRWEVEDLPPWPETLAGTQL